MAKRRQNNKVFIVLLVILLACFAVLGYGFYKYFYGGVGSTKYGDRLKDSDSYKLSATLEKDIQDIYTEESSVNTVKVNVEGKVIYININFKESLKTDDAEALAIKSLEKVGEANLTYYDVQFILTLTLGSSEEENTNYPLFGSKNSNSNKVVW